MAEPKFRSVLLHKIPDNKGWFIVGLNQFRDQESIAMLSPVVNQQLAQDIANQLSQELAGNPIAELEQE